MVNHAPCKAELLHAEGTWEKWPTISDCPASHETFRGLGLLPALRRTGLSWASTKLAEASPGGTRAERQVNKRDVHGRPIHVCVCICTRTLSTHSMLLCIYVFVYAWIVIYERCSLREAQRLNSCLEMSAISLATHKVLSGDQSLRLLTPLGYGIILHSPLVYLSSMLPRR